MDITKKTQNSSYVIIGSYVSPFLDTICSYAQH